MPTIRPPRPSRPSGPRRTTATRPRVVVVGDLTMDVVIAPARPLEPATDVPGRVALVQGGSAANTARWLARLGVRTTLVGAVGRDTAGRALVGAVRSDGVTPRIVRVSGARTARIGVVVEPGGERTFVADRGAADQLRPADLRAAWFASADVVHLPAYTLLGEPLGSAGRRAIELARGAGAAVSLDLASVGPLLAGGRRAARALLGETAPDVLFATAAEARALLAGGSEDGLLALGSVVVVKRGADGATVLARTGGATLRFDVATTPIMAADTTGAGDAFDAGFLAEWLTARAAGVGPAAALRRAAAAGNRTAGRQLARPRPELVLA